MGVDPGTRITGFGLIKKSNLKLTYITSGCIKTSDSAMAIRLNVIYEGLKNLILKYKPDCVAIEQAFAYKNIATAIKLGQARGVAMVAASGCEVEVVEYTPRQVKQSVVGYGNADKNQVQQMVKVLLNLSDMPQADAADALAIAMSHANFCKLGIKI